MSAIMKVKAISPENEIIALGQGFELPEARIAACVTGKCVSNMPGSEAIAGTSTVRIGTWEHHMGSKWAVVAKMCA